MVNEVADKIMVLPVMESFYTLQGEGFHQGKAAYFIRLAGCDVGCVWCDVKESWEAAKHPLRNVLDIVAEVAKTVAEIVVITGGEPLMHDLGALTTELKNRGFKTHIETSGAYPISGSWDWICVSPKKFKAPLPDILPFANELKVVIYHKSDLSWAELHASQVSENCKLYLQPEWEKAAVMTPLIINYIKEHPEWELSLQLHKFINIP
jgi:7-carboxy-7-deazaguanine synthase